MEYMQFLVMFCNVEGLTGKKYFRRVVPVVNIVLISDWLHIFWIFSARPLTSGRLRLVFVYCSSSFDPDFLEQLLCSQGRCDDVCLWQSKAVLTILNRKYASHYNLYVIIKRNLWFFYVAVFHLLTARFQDRLPRT